MEYPAAWPLSLTGCAHYIREPDTDNSINFAFKKGLLGRPWLEVMRYRPGDSFQTPETVGSFYPRRMSYMHSFSLTENYAVFLFYPVRIDPKATYKILWCLNNFEYCRSFLSQTFMCLKCSMVETKLSQLMSMLLV